MVRMYLKATENVHETKHHWEHLRSLVQEVCKNEKIDPKSVKAFFEEYEAWATGPGAPEGFVNLRIATVPLGKEVESNLADTLHAKLCEMYRHSLESGKASVSVEIREMNPDNYRVSP
ncbi:MAG TPA: hypothetical protein VNI20_01345 [Fimbriimonadaceae bacterium]|nr:hypothetical protein [Fimbriimonadaceae bacterium]